MDAERLSGIAARWGTPSFVFDEDALAARMKRSRPSWATAYAFATPSRRIRS